MAMNEMYVPSPEEAARGWESNWSPAQVARFWNWQSSNPVSNEMYYSKMVGQDVLDQASRVHRFFGVVVDYGAGPGYLTRFLIDRGFQVWAADVSQKSLDNLQLHMQGRPNFLGGALISSSGVQVQTESADVVFLLETIEHLNEDLLTKTLAEIRRILKPGGVLFVTTPNDEDLDKNKAYCPNCGCIFHRVQHQRRFNSQALSATLAGHGFGVVHARPTLFLHGNFLKRLIYRFGHLMRYKKLPHLLACAVKAKASA